MSLGLTKLNFSLFLSHHLVLLFSTDSNAIVFSNQRM